MQRTVRHLHLRAPSAPAAARAARRLEDALRCASLPDHGERLLLVRRLHLGPLPADLGTQGLSLLIEQRVAAAGGTWVAGTDARAPASDSVCFDSHLQAAQAALRRRVQGLPLTAWYWPLALPGVPLQAEAPVFLDHLVRGLLAQPEAPASVPALVADAVAAGAAPWLLRHGAPALAGPALQAAGLRPARTEATGRRGPARALVAYRCRDAAGRTVALPAAQAWPGWLHTWLRAAGWAPVWQAPAAAPLGGGPTAPRRSGPAGLRVPATGHGAGGAAVDADVDASLDAHVDAVAGAPVGIPHPPAPAAGRFTARSATPAAWLAPPMATGCASQAGGLLFLLVVLARLGMGAWQAQHPDAPLAGAVLRQALARLRVPADDPAWALVAGLPEPDNRAPRAWSQPPAWGDPRIGLSAGPATLTPEAMAARWLTACRRYLRRVARIGLASLCRRPAALGWSPTHLDVALPLAGTDLRVRRQALDVDPGWLPWLGRVVAFRYRAGPLPA